MIKRIFILAASSFLIVKANAQMKLGDNPTVINSASLLELESTNKGFVLPRVSLTSTASNAPLNAGLITGTLVYNTNASVTGGAGTGIYMWDGTQWIFLSTSANASSIAWLLNGNSGTNSGNNFLGTKDNVSLNFRTNNIQRLIIDSLGKVGIGSSSFNITNPEKVLIDYGITASNTIMALKGSTPSYFSNKPTK